MAKPIFWFFGSARRLEGDDQRAYDVGARCRFAYSFKLQHLLDSRLGPTHQRTGNGIVVVEMLRRPCAVDERDRCAELDSL